MGHQSPIHSRLPGALLVTLLVSPLVSYCSSVAAQQDERDAVVVTASRLEQQLTDTIAHTTVITAKDIRDSEAVDLPSLLKREAGFEFLQNGGIGSSSTISMRGGDGRQMLVLIDGVRVESATLGSTSIESIMLDEVERVEVVRGNVSALYGANAIGGVIQIFTKQGYGEPRAEAQAMVGSRGTSRESASYRGSADSTRFSMNVSHFQTDGFSQIDPRLAPNANPDNDGYHNQSFSGQLSQRVAPGHEVGLRAYQSAGKIEFDNAFGAPTDRNRAENALSSYALYSRNQLASFWDSRLTLAEGSDRSKNFTNDAAPTRFNTRNAQLQWQNDFKLAKDHVFTAGLERLQQRVDSTTAYAATARDVNSAMLAYNGRLGAHQFQASTRRDRYSDFGNADSWLAGYGYDIDARWKVTAMSSTAFTAPTFNQLFYPGFGNPNLQPERTRSNELGLQYAVQNHLLRIAAFRTRYRNLIETVQVTPEIFLPQNVARARVEGTELSYTGKFDRWDLRASLTVQDPIDTATGAQLRRRGTKFGNLVATSEVGRWRLGGEVIIGSSRPDNNISTGAPVTLGGYKLVNLTARYPIGKNMEVSAKLENAFDEKYQLVHGYNVPGRGLFLTLGWRQ